jgi:hypothetical protein
VMDLLAQRQSTPPQRITPPASSQAPSEVAPGESVVLKTIAWPASGDVREASTSEAVAPPTSAAFLPKELAAEDAAGKRLWQPPAPHLVPAPAHTPTARANNNTLLWTLAAAMAAAVAMLAGLWLLSSGKPVPVRPVTSIADPKSWEAAKKEGTVASVQAYLAAHPTGLYAAEARALLASLNPPAAPAAQAKPELPPAAQSPAPPVSDAAAQPNTSAPAAARPAPGTDTTVKPTPAPPTANAQTPANANTSPAPLVIRPRPETTKAETPTVVSTENKPPAPVEMGTVALKITPWGNVRVNRSPVGSTPPLTQLNLPEGQHQIEISNPNGASVTKLVQVIKGEVVVVSHKFD